MGPWQSVMPLSKIQSEVLALISVNRSPESYLAGATGIHMSPQAPRVSHDLDLFHSTEEAVAEAFVKEALDWISQRPAEEAGCLYADPESGRLIAPGRDEKAEILHVQPGDVFPRIQGVPARSFIESAELRAAIEGFFHRKIR